jgi:SAM-dependent methyltransferase
MEYTGERPTVEYGLVSSRMRYKLLVPHILDKKILDFGCGVGHGSYLLSQYAKSVVGFDRNKESITEAQKRFVRPNLRFVSEGTWQHKLANSGLDIIASVECVEHLEKPHLITLLRFCSDLVPSFVCTTPNGNLFSYQPKTRAERRGFHTWHYTYGELVKLFGQFYSYVDVAGHAFDPVLQKYTGFTVFATNALANWNETNFVTNPQVPSSHDDGDSAV